MNLGDSLRFSSDLYDKPVESGGVLTNAATAVLTVTLPDGTTATPTVANPSTGKYTADYQTTSASPTGRYLGHWVFTFAGGASTVYDETIDVVSTFITTDEAVAHLRAAGVITSDPDLDQLEWLCSVASDAVERDLGRDYTRKTITETHSGGLETVILRRSPVLSVTSVTESGTALTTDDYLVDTNSGVIYRGSTRYRRYFYWGRLNVTVVYEVGSLNPPPVVRKVALNAVQGMWQESQQAFHPGLDQFPDSAIAAATGALTPVERAAYESLRTVGIG